jgi:hypothetical protein
MRKGLNNFNPFLFFSFLLKCSSNNSHIRTSINPHIKNVSLQSARGYDKPALKCALF